MTALGSVGLGIANVALALAAAPLCEGIIRKVTARVQSRQGPPLWQPYFDLLKLLGKEDIESGECPRMQRVSAYLALGSTLTLATLVPMGARSPLGAAGDAIFLVYLLTLCGVSMLLAGLAAGSTYSVIGVSRGMTAMLSLEPILAAAVVIGAVKTGSLRLDSVFGGSLLTHGHWPVAGIIMIGVLLASLQAFVERVPFDVAEAETEIMEGPLAEYSGPKLALLKYAQMVKLFVYSALLVALVWPVGRDWPYPAGVLALLAQVLVIVLVVTLIGATHARYRIDQVVRYYAVLLAIAFVALGLAVTGY